METKKTLKRLLLEGITLGVGLFFGGFAANIIVTTVKDSVGEWLNRKNPRLAYRMYRM